MEGKFRKAKIEPWNDGLKLPNKNTVQMQQQTGYTHVVRKKKREFRQFKESKDMEEGDPNYLLKVKCTVDYSWTTWPHEFVHFIN